MITGGAWLGASRSRGGGWTGATARDRHPCTGENGNRTPSQSGTTYAEGNVANGEFGL